MIGACRASQTFAFLKKMVCLSLVHPALVICQQMMMICYAQVCQLPNVFALASMVVGEISSWQLLTPSILELHLYNLVLLLYLYVLKRQYLIILLQISSTQDSDVAFVQASSNQNQSHLAQSIFVGPSTRHSQHRSRKLEDIGFAYGFAWQEVHLEDPSPQKPPTLWKKYCFVE